MNDKHQDQVDQNYQAFMAQLQELMATHPGQFALMRDREIIEFYDTFKDAAVTGSKLYPDGLYSVQEVTEASVDLGYFSICPA